MNWGWDVKKLERRWSVILVTDIRGFSKAVNHADVSLADVTKFINEFFGMTSMVVGNDITAGNVEINKFLGDGFLIFLSKDEDQHGIDKPSAKEAIEMAVNLSKKFRALCSSSLYLKFNNLALGIGIACGEIVYGPFGGPLSPSGREEITGIGEFVNLAFRLTDKAKKNQILVTKEVWREINKQVVGIETVLILKGFGKRKCYEIVGFVKEG